MGLPSDCNDDRCSNQIDTPHPGICPNNWHIPTRNEWDTLENYVGENAGTKLKSEADWNSDYAPAGTDEYGFSALPGGYGYWSNNLDNFNNVGNDGYWWSVTEGYNQAWSTNIMRAAGYITATNANKTRRYSVRCVAD
jgi:uncharacterized protein (TIGR02145 family)